MSADVVERLRVERTDEGVAPRVEETTRQAVDVDYRVRIVPTRIRTGGALCVGGLALDAYDAVQTHGAAQRLRAQDNDTVADLQVMHFGTRAVGGWAGAGMVFRAGCRGRRGDRSGPAGDWRDRGVVGAFAGAKVAAWVDDRSIYTQTDPQGHEWTLDPQRQDLGWRRPAPIDGMQDGIDNARREPLRASPLLESELNSEATRRPAELMLDSSPVPRDPSP